MTPKIFFVKVDPFVIEKKDGNQQPAKSVCLDFLQRKVRLENNEILHFDNLLKGKSERIATQVSILLSNLNEKNFSLRWWSYKFTAKNPLSSSLFNELIDIILVLEVLNEYCKHVSLFVYITNLRSSHRLTIQKFFENQKDNSNRALNYDYFLFKVHAFAKAIFLIFEAFFSVRKVQHQFDFQTKNRIGLLTFLDGADRSEQDPYFGKLIEYLKKFESHAVAYLFFLYRPISSRIKETGLEKNSFVLLFRFISIKDIFWTIATVFKELFISFLDQPVIVAEREVSLFPILREHMIYELGRGYTDNLLVFRAARNISKMGTFKSMIYPFENKSFEKCLLLGLDSKVTTIGYQHSSITPRHFNFRLNGSESKITPLPDKVITVGEITQQWLVKTGNFPDNRIICGFSLRHNLDTKFDKKKFDLRNAKILFAFSSGFTEISQTIDFLKPLIKNYPEITFLFRNHINFPFDQLSNSQQKWIDNFVVKSSGSSLQDDIKWADVVVYISSTVALEALYCGAPVLRLDIDLLNSDPLLADYVPNRWVCQERVDFFAKLHQISMLNVAERVELQKQSATYVKRYLKKGKIDDYKLFLN